MQGLAARGYRAIAVNARGCEGSTGPWAKTTIYEIADDLYAVIKDLGLGPVHVVGHAGGGRYARMLATRHPESVKTVIILSSGGKFEDKERFATFFGAVMKTIAGEISPAEMDAAMLASGAFAAGNDPSPWRTGWWPVAAAQAKGGENVKAEDYSKAGGRPMLALYGKEDMVAPPRNSLALKDELAGQVTVMGLDHAAHNMLQEQPKAIIEAIDDWIKADLPRWKARRGRPVGELCGVPLAQDVVGRKPADRRTGRDVLQGIPNAGVDRLMLEVIVKGSSSESHPTPLLFVHGAWHGAWCWDEYFLDFFADRGYRALAVSLRGHGNSPTPRPLRGCSIADYVEDVKSVADDLPTRPVVIGHSMGGLVVQKYLESNAAPAGVLMASAPAGGGGPAVLRYMRRHPWRAVKGALTGYTMHNLDTPARARESMFSPGTPEADVVRYLARFQPESQRALFVDMPFRARPRPAQVSTPLLVLGAELDGTFTTAEVWATATAYGTTAEIFPEMGHDMMVEPQWDAVAERIHAWLETRSL